MAILFVLTVIIIFLADGIPLIKGKLWRELGVFCFLIASAICLVIINGLNISTPVNWLDKLLNPIGKAIF